MFSQKYKMNIDLTTQIAVSGLVYLNKELLFDNVSRLEVYEMRIQTLEPSADLLVVAAHSIFKEQMYTLSDYYTFTMLLQHWKEAIKLAEKFHIKHALDTVLKMTMATTLIAFGPTNPLTKKFEEIGVVNTAKLFSQNFELPKKYDLTTLAVAFFKKIKDDPVSMKSLSHMARSASNFSFYRKIMEHVARKTY
jgi:G3E family GTPase